MTIRTSPFIRACTISIALLGSAAVILAISLPDQAYANNGNGKGNGGGNGNNGGGNGNGGGNDNGGGDGGNGKSNGSNNGGGKGGGTQADDGDEAAKPKAAKKKTAKVSAPVSTEVGEDTAAKIKSKHKVKGADDLAHPSELGALNAAHANPRALENASPNSRVGRIAAYRDAVLEGQELAAELEEKSELLDSLDEPRPIAEIDADILIAEADVTTKQEEVDRLVDELEAAGGSDPVIEGELALARDELALAQSDAKALTDEKAEAVAYADLTEEVEELTQKVADQPLVERSALEAAANKPVTDEVEATVKALLGL